MGATRPLCTVNFCIWNLNKLSDVNKVAVNGGGCSHGRADQMRATTGALPAFEIAVAGRGAALAGLKPVGVHGQAHGAAGFTPLKAGSHKNLVQAFALGLLFDQTGAGHHQGKLDVFGDFLPDFFCAIT